MHGLLIRVVAPGKSADTVWALGRQPLWSAAGLCVLITASLLLLQSHEKGAGQVSWKDGARHVFLVDACQSDSQIDYTAAWQRAVESFQAVCDACPDIKVSLEFKPTDESTRFSVVPSTGAALLLAQEVQRPNMGLTLDVGHMIMAGENPAQSVEMVSRAGKLYGMQFGDGHSRLGAEDGLMFGSVHQSMALELLVWLQKLNYKGYIYFDTFPRNEDPIREAEYNVRRFQAFWHKAEATRKAGIEKILVRHDAMGSLELLETL